MKFFFPDSHDLVDPSFDFESERRSYSGSRQLSQQYAHEALASAPYDGMLLSKAVVDGRSKSTRYNFAQVRSLLDNGVHEFLRLTATPKRPRLAAMGDCGSFSFASESEPPYTVAEVLDFYMQCGFDYGISLDHVILGYQTDPRKEVPPDWIERHKMTMELASDFLALSNRVPNFKPIGAAQGWSPESYRDSVKQLQRMGYDYVAIGGLVPLKTPEILEVLQAVSTVRKGKTKVHLLGISRLESFDAFEAHGVASLDSTAPLKQAFMDDKNNYHTPDGLFTAIRIPQVDGNPQLRRSILAGRIDLSKALQLERGAMSAVLAYANRKGSLDSAVDALRTYEQLWSGKKDSSSASRVTLQARPWEKCSCSICKTIGVHVVIFRGAERNRRRGFHNLFVLHNNLLQLNSPSTSL
ncbi:MAG: queuine/other tRNA-ribosyltransferase [Verrucomicrobiae bacterium]|nr:queuine/other tRNA-ribosyltransferase [Verrucomicrobiae bacterium]